MADDKTTPDVMRDCVICDEEYQVAFWTHHFRVSAEVLLDVVRRVGPRVEKVAAELLLHPGPK